MWGNQWDHGDSSDEEGEATTFSAARTAALRAIIAVSDGPEEVLAVSKHRALEAVQRCILSRDEEVDANTNPTKPFAPFCMCPQRHDSLHFISDEVAARPGDGVSSALASC